MTCPKWYVVSELTKWESTHIVSGDIRIGVQSKELGIGFMPVYDSLKALRKRYPKADYFCVQPCADAGGEGK